MKAGKSRDSRRLGDHPHRESFWPRGDNVQVEAGSAERAKLASGILEKGVDAIVVTGSGASEIREIVRQCKVAGSKQDLCDGQGLRALRPVGSRPQGLRRHNFPAPPWPGACWWAIPMPFSFLCMPKPEHNEYVASRPFKRVNAGAVHAYVTLPDDKNSLSWRKSSGRPGSPDCRFRRQFGHNHPLAG